MQNKVYQNTSKPFATIVSIITILNIFATLFIGFISFYYIGVGDPTSNTIDIEAFIIQKNLQLNMTKALTLFFIVGFIISLVLWLKGRHYWDFIFSGIALLHILVLIYCIAIIQVPRFFYLVVVLDLALAVVILLNRRSQYSSIKI
jgi:hypothetical protein